VVKGSVTISIEDYHAFIDSNIIFKDKLENLTVAAKELQVFLSFICNQTDIEHHIDSFNKQSNTSSIEFINGRAQIKFKNDDIKK